MDLFNIVYLPANQAWAIIFGEDFRTAKVLAIRVSRTEAQALLELWRQQPTAESAAQHDADEGPFGRNV